MKASLTHRIRSLFGALALGFLLLGIASCGGGGSAGGGGGIGGTGSPSTLGTVNFSLTDAPACGFDAVNVTIERVRVHASDSASSGGNGATGAAVGDGNGDTGTADSGGGSGAGIGGTGSPSTAGAAVGPSVARVADDRGAPGRDTAPAAAAAGEGEQEGDEREGAEQGTDAVGQSGLHGFVAPSSTVGSRRSSK